ncbi:MAG TPA: SIMPL domain-containing protein [Nocardioidaceae bacterium]|nr:SIMPL domain-containing protein [Nocardioidaceae bacterium]
MSDDAFVEVTGHGSAAAPPDQARINFAAVGKAAQLPGAFESATSSLTAMRLACREHGVADLDLATSDMNVSREPRRGGEPGIFRVSIGVRATVRDVARTGEILAAAVEAGGNASRVHDLDLRVSEQAAARAEAREAAWADALRGARRYADVARRELGELLWISEIPPQVGGSWPIRYDLRKMSKHAAQASLPSPGIDPGTLAVHATVTARWKLQPGNR